MSVLRSFLLLAALAPAALCAESPERTPPPWERTAALGRLLFRENCAVCHEINHPAKGRKLGPSLFRFFRNERTPLSRIKPTETFLAGKIKAGGPVMPPFRAVLRDDQIEKIVSYIRLSASYVVQNITGFMWPPRLCGVGVRRSCDRTVWRCRTPHKLNITATAETPSGRGLPAKA